MIRQAVRGPARRVRVPTAAVKRAQQFYGLTVDGIVGNQNLVCACDGLGLASVAGPPGGHTSLRIQLRERLKLGLHGCVLRQPRVPQTMPRRRLELK